MHNEVLEDLIVVKRSGQRVSFNASKVAIAIKKAFDSTNNQNDKKIFKIFEKVLTHINENYKDRKTINVEDIQDIIEKMLKEEKCDEEYISFNEYREKRALSRKLFAEKGQHKFTRMIEKLEENATNKDNKVSSDILYEFGKITAGEYTKAYILDSKSIKFLEEGNIYIHNLDYFYLGMFSSVNLKLNIKNYDEYEIDNLINNIKNTEKEVFEEIGINKIDYLLEPIILRIYQNYIIDLLKKYLNICGFNNLINIQKINELIRKQNSIEINSDDYKQYLPNERLLTIFNQSILDAKEMIKTKTEDILKRILLSLNNITNKNIKYTISLGSNESGIGKMINEELLFILSKIICSNINIVLKIKKIDMSLINKIYNIFNKRNKIYILFYDKEEPEYFTSGLKVFDNINGIAYSNGRLVISSTSIDMARLGLKYQNKDIQSFYNELDSVLETCKNELLLSFEMIGDKQANYYQTLFKNNIYEDEKLDETSRIRKVIKNGTLNIGLIGLKECVTLLEPNETKRYEMIESILKYLNNRCKQYSIDNKLNIGLFEPIDKYSRSKLLSIDKAIYGDVNKATNKKAYELIDNEFIDNYKSLAKISKYYNHGKIINYKIPGKVNLKKLTDAIEILSSSGVEFAKIEVGINED